MLPYRWQPFLVAQLQSLTEMLDGLVPILRPVPNRPKPDLVCFVLVKRLPTIKGRMIFIRSLDVLLKQRKKEEKRRLKQWMGRHLRCSRYLDCSDRRRGLFRRLLELPLFCGVTITKQISTATLFQLTVVLLVHFDENISTINVSLGVVSSHTNRLSIESISFTKSSFVAGNQIG